MNKTKISKTTTGNVGEHYVAAELERINFTTSVVGNNCKDYDIIAINNETHDDVLIQVKTSSKRNRWRVNTNNYNEDKIPNYINELLPKNISVHKLNFAINRAYISLKNNYQYIPPCPFYLG